MLFGSATFLIFFAAVLVLHYLPINWTLKKLNLLGASYLFYAASNPPFLFLLGISTLAAWLTAIAMGQSRTPCRRRFFLCISLLIDLGLLVYFKYALFLLKNFASAVEILGLHYRPPAWDIALPLGIS